jgi:hypothetical protein
MTATLAPPAPPVPSAPRRTPPAAVVWAATAWLAALGLAAIVVGGHDVVAASEITVRLWGTLVLGAGAVVLAGAFGLRAATPYGRALALVAALLGVALGAMTLLVQVSGDQADLRLLVWGAIIGASAATALVVHRLTPPGEQGGILARLPVLKSVVSVGVVISFGQFWYTAIYIPTTAPANLTLEPKLTPSVEDDRIVLQGTVSMRNTSGTRVNVLASYLDVSVSNDTLQQANFAPYRSEIVDGHQGNQPTAELFRQHGSFVSVLHESPVADGTYFEPDETITVSYLTWVPKDLYSRATVDVQLTIARARALALEAAEPKVSTHGRTTTSVTEIPESGWLRSLTRGDRFVRVDYDDRDLWVYPRVRLTPAADRAPADFDDRMGRFYGLSTVESSTDITLPPEEG